MEAMFLKILNMSVTASYVILAVLALRLLLKKAPKRFSYLLWSVVGFRLCCPVSFTAVFSLFSMKPFDMTKAQTAENAALRYVPDTIGTMTQPAVTTGIPAANALINPTLPAVIPEYSINPMQIWLLIGTAVWLAGFAALLIYGVVSYIRLRRRMASAVKLEGNVYESDKVGSPFVLGFARPKIYIPFGLDKSAQHYVLTHERHHLRRFDHIVKPFAFLLLALHWFNPLCWLAFMLMSRDMEMSCDERVLTGEQSINKSYSLTLQSFATGRRFPAPSPLAFSEADVKQRIKNGATAHVFRHCYLTMLDEAGVDPKALQYIAGHGNFSFTMNRYVHGRKKAAQEAGVKFETLIAKPSDAQPSGVPKTDGESSLGDMPKIVVGL